MSCNRVSLRICFLRRGLCDTKNILSYAHLISHYIFNLRSNFGFHEEPFFAVSIAKWLCLVTQGYKKVILLVYEIKLKTVKLEEKMGISSVITILETQWFPMTIARYLNGSSIMQNSS